MKKKLLELNVNAPNSFSKLYMKTRCSKCFKPILIPSTSSNAFIFGIRCPHCEEVNNPYEILDMLSNRDINK